MDIRQLEYFLALVKQENISATANLLGVTQSALSKSIAKLEEEVGVALFDRHGNRISLNNYGKNFANYAAHALEILDTGIFTTRQTLHEVLGTVQITCHAYSGILEDVVTDYAFLNPGVQIVIHRHAPRSEVTDDQYDFILCSGHDAVSFLENSGSWAATELFREESQVLLTDTCHPFPEDRTSLSLAELKDTPFIGMQESSHMFSDLTFRLCTASGFVPQVAFETNDFLFKTRLVGSGLAACILPECCIADAKKLYPAIRSYRIEGLDTCRSVYLVRRRKLLMSEVATDFWDFVLEHYNLEPDDRD